MTVDIKNIPTRELNPKQQYAGQISGGAGAQYHLMTAHPFDEIHDNIFLFKQYMHTIQKEKIFVESKIADIVALLEKFNLDQGRNYIVYKTEARFTERKLNPIDESIIMVNPDELRLYFEENIDVFREMENIKSIIKEILEPEHVSLKYYFDIEDEWEILFINIYIKDTSYEYFKSTQDNLYSIFDARLPKSVAEKVIPRIKLCS